MLLQSNPTLPLHPAPDRQDPHCASHGADRAPAAACDVAPLSLEFGESVSPHLPAMVRAARSILGSEDLAWDAVQETLLRAWVRGSLPGEARSVLVHLAIKSSLHLLRCQRRRNDHESQAGEGAPVCCDEHPLAALDHAETARVVRDAVAGLTQEYRAVVELFEFQGESYEAIAARLSLPIGTVRSRLSRGRRLLRDRLLAHYRAA